MTKLKEVRDQARTAVLEGKDVHESFQKEFANDVATLVAILAVNDRQQEAEEIAALAREEWDDSSFHYSLVKALRGVVPVPWP